MAPDDYVFVNLKGKEIGRIEDPNVRAVVIVTDENLKTFEAGQYVWSLEYKKSLGTVYRMEGVDQLYENSVNDLAEPYDNEGNLQVSDGKGNPRYDVSVEHGASTVPDAQGNVKVGNNEVAGTPYSVIIDRPSDGFGDVHSHPNEGKGAIKMDKGGFYIDTEHRGPSGRDLNKSAPPKTGYYNIMVDDKDYYFYDRSNIIKIPKGKL